jgi:hypothetical protein
MKTAIIDIDGTLADCRHRLHHVLPGAKRDWDAFFAAMDDDVLIRPVADVAAALADKYKVVLCSGRPEKYRGVTESWLDRNCVARDALYMRPDNDTRADRIVKMQLLHGIREDGFEPFIVIDDRQSVVDAWREAGLICLQAAPSDNTVPATAHLTLMVGPSGAGKSSWLESADAWRFQIHPSHVISSDQTRADLYGDFRYQGGNDQVYAALHAVVKARLRAGLPTVVDATNIRTKDRTSLATMFNVRVRYLVLNRPMDKKRRDGGWRNEIENGTYDLIGRHEATFNSNEKAILTGDGLLNVEVVDLRQKEMRRAA